jgi:hypothetical protein
LFKNDTGFLQIMKVHELLAQPDSWTQQAYARNHDGDTVASCSDDARCWCLLGAMFRCYADKDIAKIELKILDQTNKITVAQWNDDPDRTHQEVLDLCRQLDI